MFSPPRVIGKACRVSQAADYRGVYTPRSPPRITGVLTRPARHRSLSGVTGLARHRPSV